MTAFQAALDLGLSPGLPAGTARTETIAGPGLGSPVAAVAAKGVVYTKPWVADLVLDLAGYRPEEDLAGRLAVEPSAGAGAFLGPMVQRLLCSVKAHGRPLDDIRDSIRAHELDATSAARAVGLAAGLLRQAGAGPALAQDIAEGWVTAGDYLMSAQELQADLVVGNPPYVRYDDVPAAALAAYRQRYPTMVGRGDIYVGFIEAGLRQLKDGGILAFICADRWMRAAYGAQLRRLIGLAFSVDAVIEMHDAAAFDDDVAAYPAVVSLRCGPQGPVVVATAGPGAGPPPAGTSLADAVTGLAHGRTASVPGFTATVADHWFRGGGPWPCLPPAQLALLQHLEAGFAPLEDELTGTKIGIGVATGADRIFITTDPEAAEPDRMVPLAMTADTRNGALQWSGHFLLNPWKRSGGLVDLAAYPRLRARLRAQMPQLQDRHVARRNTRDWYRTIDPVRHDLTARPKLYFPDMKLTSHPVLDRGGTYPHHNLYYLTSQAWDLEVLGGLLLSRVAQLFIEAYCVKMRGGTLRFQAQYLRRIRVPDPAAIPATVNEQLRQAFRSRDPDAATVAAAEAYGISDLAGTLLC